MLKATVRWVTGNVRMSETCIVLIITYLFICLGKGLKFAQMHTGWCGISHIYVRSDTYLTFPPHFSLASGHSTTWVDVSGLISGLTQLGDAYQAGNDNNRPVCFRLAFSILHGLQLNTKQHQCDAQSRLEEKASTHPSTRHCPPLSSTSPPTVLRALI